MRSVIIKDHMTTDVETLHPDTEIAHAAQFLVAQEISGAPVVDELGRLVGILTERDCIEVAMQADYYGEPGGLVSDYMTPEPQTVSPEQSILTLAEMFIRDTYRRYPVVDNGRMVGIISRRDVMRAMGKHYPK